MALNDENGGGIPATMLVGPATFGGAQTMPYYPMPMWGGGNGGNGMFGGDGSWIILLIIVLLVAGGGWGNNFGGNNGGFGGAPIVINDGGNNGSAVQRGFDQAAVMSGVSALQSGISALSTQLCGCCGDMQNTMNQGFNGVQQSLCTGFAGVNATVNGAQNAIAQQLYANQIADMERSFAAQTAQTAGMTALQAQLAQCCCDNRAATADLKYTVANEACADRAAVTSALQAVTTQNAANTQRILDQMCQDKIDAKNEQIANLQSQLQMAQLAASQNAQTAQILANNEAQTAALERYLAPNPIPAYIVQNPGCCNQNFSCGCGCNS